MHINSMHTQKLVEFHPFVIKILSGNEILTSISGHNSVINLGKTNPRSCQGQCILHIQNLDKFCPFFMKILSRNKLLTSIKGQNSVTNLRKMTGNTPNLELVNINTYTKFGKVLFMCVKQNFEQNSDINQGL